jgi:hypothetical protein
MKIVQSKSERLFLVEVELIGKLGGSRTYTFRYNLHYNEPEVGEVVIVPFGTTISAGIALKTTDLSNYSLLDTFWAEAAGRALIAKLRPVLGIARENEAFSRLVERTRYVMDTYLRSASASFALWLASSFEREIGVFFFARPTNQGYTSTSAA